MSKLSITVKVAIMASQFSGEHECNFQTDGLPDNIRVTTDGTPRITKSNNFRLIAG
jgi:hypothetical protein